MEWADVLTAGLLAAQEAEPKQRGLRVAEIGAGPIGLWGVLAGKTASGCKAKKQPARVWNIIMINYVIEVLVDVFPSSFFSSCNVCRVAYSTDHTSILYIYGTALQPPRLPPRDGHGQEDHVYGGAVPYGYVTPAPPVGVGRGLWW